MKHKLYTAEAWQELEEKLVEEIEQKKQEQALAPVVVLVGSRLLALYLERKVYLALEPKGLGINIHFLIFPDLVERLIYTEPFSLNLSSASQFYKYLLCEKILRESDDSYFSSLSQSQGLIQILLSGYRDLKDGLIIGEGYERAKKAILSSFPERKENLNKIFQLIEKIDQGMEDKKDAWKEFLLASARADRFPQVFKTDQLLIYGFYDYTAIQRKLISSLAKNLHLTLFMVLPQERFYSDFALKVYQEFYLKKLKANEEKLSAKGISGGLGVFFSSFKEENLEKREISDDRIRVIFAPGIEREVKEVCREILYLVRERGIKFEEIGILVRDFNTYHSHLEKAFNRYRIPYFLGEKKALVEFPVIQCLQRLLRIIKEDYSRQSVVSFFTHQAIKSSVFNSSPELVGLFELVSRDAGIISGVDDWRSLKEYLKNLKEEIQKLKKEEPEREDKISLLENKHQSAEMLFKLTDELLRELEELKQLKTCSQLSQKLKTLAEKYLDFGFVANSLRDDFSEGDFKEKFFQLFEKILNEISLLDQEGFKANREDFISLVEQGLEQEGVWLGSYSQGRVCLSELMTARGVKFRVLILPGLNEGSFPIHLSESPLLGDDEREIINGLFREGFLSLKRNQALEERLLYYLACHQADEYLILSSSWMEISSGKVKPPSYLLIRNLSRILGKELEIENLENYLKELSWVKWTKLLELSPREPEQALDSEEWEAIQLSSSPIEQFSHLKKNPVIERITRMTYERWLEAKPGIYNACFSEVEGYEPGWFSPLQRKLSHSQLKEYFECPFKYFLNRVLGVEPVEAPAWNWEVGKLERGIFFHSLLEKAFKKIKARKEISTAEQWRKLIEEIIQQEDKEEVARELCLFPALVESELDEYILYLYSWYQHLLPEPDYNYWKTEEDFYNKPVKFEVGEGKIVRLTGKIDRLDLKKQGRKFIQGGILDYKVASKKNDLINNSQLLIYFLAVENLYGIPRERLKAKFLYIQPEGLSGPEKLEISGDELEDKLEKLKEMLNLMLEGIEKGIFYIIPEPNGYCAYCDYYKKICFPDTEKLSPEFLSQIKELRKLKWGR